MATLRYQLGELGRFTELLLAPAGPEAALYRTSGWELAPGAEQALVAALDASPEAAFACARWDWAPAAAGPPSGGCRAAEHRPPTPPAPNLTLDALLSAPVSLGPLAVRRSDARGLGLPDWGPSDTVLDYAGSWALAVAILARDGFGIFIPHVLSSRVGTAPEDIDLLTAEGTAWLVDRALGWLPGGRPGPAAARALWPRWSAGLSHNPDAPGWSRR